MAKDRVTANDVGYGRSAKQTITIPNGATGSGLYANLGRNYAYIVVRCTDCSNIAASTNLSALVAYDENETMCTLYERDDPSTAWSKGSLPTSGTLSFVLVHALGAQFISLVLSNAASGGSVVFEVYGIAESIAG